ncbi:MAG: hypothetical protein MPW13_15340 [Candidatus Manganitrophus sp.]|nr:hypothetical protein [Candidatus Manganitrophus sp.]
MIFLQKALLLALFFFFSAISPLYAQTEPVKAGEMITDAPPPPSPRFVRPRRDDPGDRAEKKRARKRSQELDQKEERLRLMEQEVGQMLKKYSEIREALEEKEKKRKLTEDEQLGRLAKMYAVMPPEEAAARIEKMDESLALNLLEKIKEKSAAQILTNLSPVKAAKLTEKLARTRR